MNIVKVGAIVVLLGAGLAGCESHTRLGSDFGSAVHQDLAAQIANPEARYGTRLPPLNGVRAAGVQERYQTDTALTADVHASTIGATGQAAPAPAAPAAPAGQ